MPWPLSPSLFAKRVWSGSCRVDAIQRKAKFGMGLKGWRSLFPVFSIFLIFTQVIILVPDCWRCSCLCSHCAPQPMNLLPHSHRDVKEVIQATCLRGKGELRKTLPAQGNRQFWEKRKHFQSIRCFWKSASWHSIKCCPNGFLCLHIKLLTYSFLIRSYHRFKCHCSPQDIATEQNYSTPWCPPPALLEGIVHLN